MFFKNDWKIKNKKLLSFGLAFTDKGPTSPRTPSHKVLSKSRTINFFGLVLLKICSKIIKATLPISLFLKDSHLM